MRLEGVPELNSSYEMIFANNRDYVIVSSAQKIGSGTCRAAGNEHTICSLHVPARNHSEALELKHNVPIDE